ncbi:MAG TPA: RDD family protein [Candidatus Dormibacteraeota bacterium]|nr:RDD family protein [Candidatus Dormibacteraeota bacterium]
MLRINDGKVAVEDSVATSRTTTGSDLRDSYLKDIQKLTAGLIRVRESGLYIGPLHLLRLGRAKVTRHAVEWPIEGGMVARAAGGRFRIEADGGRLVASVEGYRPRLPLPLYRVTQLPIHHLLVRLHLLRVRGREPSLGLPATSQDRLRAAIVDVALCTVLTGVISKRPRLSLLLGVAAAYHVTCWSTSGRTLGGLVMRQRVVAVDGSRPTVGQSVVRLLALPFGWARGRPVQDEAAETTVIKN